MKKEEIFASTKQCDFLFSKHTVFGFILQVLRIFTSVNDFTKHSFFSQSNFIYQAFFYCHKYHPILIFSILLCFMLFRPFLILIQTACIYSLLSLICLFSSIISKSISFKFYSFNVFFIWCLFSFLRLLSVCSLIKLLGLFNAKSILLKEQQWYNLTNCYGYLTETKLCSVTGVQTRLLWFLGPAL